MTSVTVTEEPTTVTVIDEDGTTVTVESLETVVQVDDVGAPGATGPAHEAYPFSMQSTIEVAITGTTQIPLSGPGQLVSVQGSLTLPAVGADVIVDVLLNDVSVWDDPDDRPTILAGESDFQLVTTFDTDTFVTGDRLTVHVVQVGSSFAGDGLVVVPRVRLT